MFSRELGNEPEFRVPDTFNVGMLEKIVDAKLEEATMSDLVCLYHSVRADQDVMLRGTVASTLMRLIESEHPEGASHLEQIPWNYMARNLAEGCAVLTNGPFPQLIQNVVDFLLQNRSDNETAIRTCINEIKSACTQAAQPNSLIERLCNASLIACDLMLGEENFSQTYPRFASEIDAFFKEDNSRPPSCKMRLLLQELVPHMDSIPLSADIGGVLRVIADYENSNISTVISSSVSLFARAVMERKAAKLAFFASSCATSQPGIVFKEPGEGRKERSLQTSLEDFHNRPDEYGPSTSLNLVLSPSFLQAIRLLGSWWLEHGYKDELHELHTEVIKFSVEFYAVTHIEADNGRALFFLTAEEIKSIASANDTLNFHIFDVNEPRPN